MRLFIIRKDKRRAKPFERKQRTAGTPRRMEEVVYTHPAKKFSGKARKKAYIKRI